MAIVSNINKNIGWSVLIITDKKGLGHWVYFSIATLPSLKIKYQLIGIEKSQEFEQNTLWLLLLFKSIENIFKIP